MQPSHKVWLAAHGSGPWPCHGCTEPVERLGGKGETRGVIHHEDRDHDNDALSNLRVMHHPCHVAEHHSRTSRQLAGLLREQIQAGEMPRWMPSLTRLASEHQLAVCTVQKALAILKNEGLVVTYPGRGTFVA